MTTWISACFLRQGYTISTRQRQREERRFGRVIASGRLEGQWQDVTGRTSRLSRFVLRADQQHVGSRKGEHVRGAFPAQRVNESGIEDRRLIELTRAVRWQRGSKCRTKFPAAGFGP